LNSGDSRKPAIAIESNGTLHIVWYDDTPGNGEIYSRGSTDGGTNWTTSKRLTWTSSSSFRPAAARDSNNFLYAVWYEDMPGNSEIFYKVSNDGGLNWSLGQRLTWTSGDSFNPAIAIDSDDTCHIVWFDDSPGNYEVYYIKGK
jgi:phage terminase large subunit-like protein